MSDTYPQAASRKRRNARSCIACLSISLLLLVRTAPTCLAENEKPNLQAKEFSNCSWYRSKQANVPVYAEAERSGEIKSRLRLGEYVCYIGEENGFAILDWEKQALLRNESTKNYSSRGFVRLTELWEPEQKGKELPGAESTLRQTWELGASPEDPLWMLRPFLGVLLSPDPCADQTKIGCRPNKDSKSSESGPSR